MSDSTTGTIQSRKDYKDNPAGQYRYWAAELKASDKNLRNFRKQGSKIVKRFLGGATQQGSEEVRGGKFRLNLFHTNVITMQSMLYGNVPKVDVVRRHNDPNDDVGRVAAEIISRLLNNDVMENPEHYSSTLKAALQDRLLPGLGVARVRYDFNAETEEESAPLEYFHWRDMAWGWARTFNDVPWIGFRSYLDKDEVTARWGEEIAEALTYENQSTIPDKDGGSAEDDDGPWQKAAIWEMWDKVKLKVIWLCVGYDKVLEEKDDFLKINQFYPCPPFLLANQTTTLYTPVSDFSLSQDLYNEIDQIQTRISIITEAVKVVGVYNQQAADLTRVFKEGTDNDLIPVDNWALFAESGGIKGQIDWVPMKEIVETLSRLRELRDETIGLLQQTTGMSDIMRGQLDNQYEGVGQSQDKTKFGSIRVQALQDEFAAFASSLLQIKANIIGIHYDPETIARLANTESFMEADKELIPSAIELIKNPSAARLHINIRPETLAMVDYAQLKAERVEFLSAIGNFMQATAPILEQEPTTAPFMMQLLQWGLAGFKGSNQIEGVIDKAIQTTQEAAKNAEDKPDPEKAAAAAAMELETMKHKNAMELITAKLTADQQANKFDMNVDIEKIRAKAQADATTMREDLQADITKIREDLKADLAVIAAKKESDLMVEAASSQINAEQNTMAVENEIEKDAISASLAIQVDQRKADEQGKQETSGD